MPGARGNAAFWAHAATFGALWGSIEATVGSFLHAVRLPFGGTVLAATGAALLLALRVVYPRRGVLVAAGAVCAAVKMVAPATVIVGPMVGIMVESLLIELACVLGSGVLPAVVGGALATTWALMQQFLMQLVLFGAPIASLYVGVLSRAEAWLGLPRTGGLWVAGPFVALVALGGAATAVAGLSAGRRAVAQRGAGSVAAGKVEKVRGVEESKPEGGPGRSGLGIGLTVLAALMLLVGLVLLPAWSHGLLAVVVLAIAVTDVGLRRSLGHPLRGLGVLVLLVALGAWLGRHDAQLGAVHFSRSGALAAVTMTARALGLLVLTSALTRLMSGIALLARLARTPARPLVASVAVAVRLAPEITLRLRRDAAALRIERPGVLRLPARAQELLVRAVAHAAAVADEVAAELQPSDLASD